MKVTLVVHGKERDGETFEFTKPGSLLFGRSAKAHCQIAHDPYVSRLHFILLINPPEVQLRNLSQTNGTMVDGVLYTQQGRAVYTEEAKTLVKPVAGESGAEALLRDGSLIEVGYTTLKVTIEAPSYCTKCGTPLPCLGEAETIPICDDCLSKESSVEAQREPKDSSPREVRRPQDLRPAAQPHLQDQAGQMVANAIHRFLKKLAPSDPQLAPPRPQIPGHDVEGQLAEGAMGVIYRALRLRDDRLVALKIIRPDRPLTREGRGRFKREIAIMTSLNHSHIITVHDSGEIEGKLWYTMGFVEGGLDVRKHLQNNGDRLPADECVQIVLGALDGLAYAHGRGIVHRDLKPSNILLSSEAGSLTAKLTDFGIAKSLVDTGLNGSILTKKAVMGTLPYMPPEQAVDLRTCRPSADVFSMGATLYEMLSGQHIREYSVHVNEAVLQALDEPIVPIRDRQVLVSSDLEQVIERALKLEPDKRFQHAGEFYDALKSVAL